MATYVGFFSNIKDGSFHWSSQWGSEDSDPLDDTTDDGSWYKVAGYPYNNLHNYGIKANTPVGFRFVGWYTLSSNRTTTDWYQISQSMLSSTPLSTSESFIPNSSTLRTFRGQYYDNEQYYLLFAKYDNKFTVTLNKKGGSGGTETVTATYGQSMPKITVPTRAGYTFAGYYDTDSSTGGIQYYTASGTSARNWDKSSDATLYARWIGNELIVTYNPNGGWADRYFDRVRAGGTFPALPTATYGSETTSRWYTAKIGGTEVHHGDAVTQTADFTLYAHWSVPVNAHTLTFNANGGTVSPATRTLAEGAAFGTLPTPTRSGYTFVEWRTAPYVGTLVTSSTKMGTDDVTIYAIWRGNAITITLNANGGTVTPTTKSVDNGSVYGVLPRPTRSGYAFDGWWTAATGGTEILATAKPSGNQTVYAHWKQDGGEVVPWVF